MTRSALKQVGQRDTGHRQGPVRVVGRITAIAKGYASLSAKTEAPRFHVEPVPDAAGRVVLGAVSMS